MNIWAIADLHLCFSTPNKSMEIFGENWKNYVGKIQKNWEDHIANDDIVLIAGDISWAMHLSEAFIDLNWLDQLPGTKILLKGNHDYWWSSISKMQQVMPSSLFIVHNNSLYFHEIAFGGARLWDTKSLNYAPYIQKQGSFVKKTPLDQEKDQKIFQRELVRLELSLSQLNPKAKVRIAMTHYPPIGPHLESSPASDLLEKHHIDICVFGHIHNMQPSANFFGEKNGVQYFLTSSDYLNFMPIKIL